MPTEQQIVETVFTATDKASGPTKQLSKNYAELSKEAEKVQKTRKLPAAMGEFSGEKRAHMQEERSLMRARRFEAHHAARPAVIGEQMAHMSMQMLGMHMEGPAGKFVELGGAAGSMGAQLAMMGGKAGKVGAAMEKLGGVFAAAGAGYALGSWLDEKLELSEKISDNMGDFASSLFGATLGLQNFASAEEVKEQNKAYVEALGYRSVADYNAAKKITEGNAEQARLKAATKLYASQVGVLSATASPEETARYNANLMRLTQKVKENANIHSSMGAVLQALAEAGKADVSGQQQVLVEKRASADAVQAASTQWARGLGAVQIGATGKALADMNQQTMAFAMKLPQVVSGAISLEEGMRVASSALMQSSATLMSASRQRSAMDIIYSDATDSVAKDMAKSKQFDRKTQAGRLAFDSALHDAALRIGPRGDAAEQERIYQELKTKTMTKSGPPQVNFNNNRFDIKQDFAEGFDPDRIAVAFSSDLAKLGERRLQSGLAPVFAGIR